MLLVLSLSYLEARPKKPKGGSFDFDLIEFDWLGVLLSSFFFSKADIEKSLSCIRSPVYLRYRTTSGRGAEENCDMKLNKEDPICSSF